MKITKKELDALIENKIQKVMQEASLTKFDLTDRLIVNPKTGKKIKMSTALAYDKDHPAYKAAQKIIASSSKPTSNIDKLKQTYKELTDNNEHEKAYQVYKQIIKLDPRYKEGQKKLASLYKSKNNVFDKNKIKSDINNIAKKHKIEPKDLENELNRYIDSYNKNIKYYTDESGDINMKKIKSEIQSDYSHPGADKD